MMSKKNYILAVIIASVLITSSLVAVAQQRPFGGPVASVAGFCCDGRIRLTLKDYENGGNTTRRFLLNPANPRLYQFRQYSQGVFMLGLKSPSFCQYGRHCHRTWAGWNIDMAGTSAK